MMGEFLFARDGTTSAAPQTRLGWNVVAYTSPTRNDATVWGSSPFSCSITSEGSMHVIGIVPAAVVMHNDDQWEITRRQQVRVRTCCP